MKNLIILLLLFSFSFGAYCVPSADDSGWVHLSSQSDGFVNLPVYDYYKIVNEGPNFTWGICFYCVDSGGGYCSTYHDNLGVSTVWIFFFFNASLSTNNTYVWF